MLTSLMLQGEALQVAVDFCNVEKILPTPAPISNTAPIDGHASLPPSLEYIGARYER